MFSYDVNKMKLLLAQVIQQHVEPAVWNWLQGVHEFAGNAIKWNSCFAMIPRKTGRNVITIPSKISTQVEETRRGLSLAGWTADKLCRVYLLLELNASDKEKYIRQIENLFLCGEVSELAALYSSLPLLAYPKQWINRCAEGIRNNMASVLESIMYHNPYPAEQFETPAWNQMILKAIFTDKDLTKITGLKERANKELAYSLVDYANERCSAKRTINPQLWQLIGRFIDDHSFAGVLRVFNSEDIEAKKSMIPALSQSGYEPAKTLIHQYLQAENSMENKPITKE